MPNVLSMESCEPPTSAHDCYKLIAIHKTFVWRDRKSSLCIDSVSERISGQVRTAGTVGEVKTRRRREKIGILGVF